MAQGTTKPKSAPKRASSKSSTAKRSKAKSRPKPKSRAKSSSKAKSGPKRKSTPKPKSSSNSSATNGKVTNGKATLPLVAGGAALVGAAGGIALGAAKSGSKVLGVRLPHPKRVQIRSKDLSKAAKRVGSFGDQVGDLTAELRSLRQRVADDKGNSPLEVLLKGLTERR